MLHKRNYSDITRSSAVYFLLNLMPHDTEIIRELILVEKHLSKTTDTAYPFEIKDRSSSDVQPVLPKILGRECKKITRRKKWRISAFFYCLCLSMCLTTHVCTIIYSLQLLFAKKNVYHSTTAQFR